jgi:hypothetical protein
MSNDLLVFLDWRTLAWMFYHQPEKLPICMLVKLRQRVLTPVKADPLFNGNEKAASLNRHGGLDHLVKCYILL